MENRKVNLFVIGAMKAGTTSFVDMLSKHPDIYIAPIKEPHFFVDELPKNLYEPSRFFDLDHYFENDFPNPLHITKIETSEQYSKLFSGVNEQKYRCDSSTGYLQCPGTAHRIFNYNSSAKIVVILRDPLKRAYSHYRMDMALSRSNRTFEEIMSKEVTNYQNGQLPWNSYLGMSFYEKALSDYKNYFKDILILDFEHLKTDDSREWKKLSQFLEIPDFIDPALIHKNKTRSLRFQKLFFVLKRLGAKDFFSSIFRSSFKRKLFYLLSRDKVMEMDLSPDLKREINQIFKLESPQC